MGINFSIYVSKEDNLFFLLKLAKKTNSLFFYLNSTLLIAKVSTKIKKLKHYFQKL